MGYDYPPEASFSFDSAPQLLPPIPLANRVPWWFEAPQKNRYSELEVEPPEGFEPPAPPVEEPEAEGAPSPFAASPPEQPAEAEAT